MIEATRLSVVIPTLNEAENITRLLTDLKAQLGPNDEVVLVDGGSNDGTLNIATPDVDRVLQSSPGRANQMNLGAERANGQFLWFLHADTRIPPGAIQKLIAAVSQEAQWGRFDIRLSGNRWPLRVIEYMINQRSRFTGIATGDQGLFVKATLFRQLGGYPAIALMEDIALTKQLRRLSSPCCIRHPRLQTSSRRWEHQGTIRTVLLMWRLRLAYALGASPEALARRYR